MWIDRAPPVRIVALITLVCSTLDLLADLLLCIKFSNETFHTSPAIAAVHTYYAFTAISILVYAFEVYDAVTTIKNNAENSFWTPFTKSLMLVFEEVPLPACLLVIYLNEPHNALVRPATTICWIKLITLSWGVVKFIKLKFVWCCIPCTYPHDQAENARICFTPSLTRAAMLFVNTCHMIAIGLVIANLVVRKDAVASEDYADYDTSTITPENNNHLLPNLVLRNNGNNEEYHNNNHKIGRNNEENYYNNHHKIGNNGEHNKNNNNNNYKIGDNYPSSDASDFYDPDRPVDPYFNTPIAAAYTAGDDTPQGHRFNSHPRRRFWMRFNAH